MKPMTAALALGGACAACCALPLLAGAGIFAAAGGAAYVGGATGIALAAAAGGIAWYALRRRQPPVPRLSQPAAACGCTPRPSAKDEAPEEPIACTLQGDDFKSRAAWIRGVAERHLRNSMRSPLTLYLVYAPEAADEVREMVIKERACCAFLRFDLSITNGEVHLLITAPETAREAADMLFDHFAPELASAEAA